MENYDVIIIGGGPGGYVAAIRAAQLGQKTLVVEKNHLGGICLNWGCIPTKALLKSAELYLQLKHSDIYGISASNISFDISKITARSREISAKLVSGIKGLLKKNKVTVIEGSATLEGKKVVKVETKEGEKTIQAKNIIIATGARARVLPGFEPNGENIWTYREALTPTALPKSMIVVGSGAIGIEFASFYNALGCNVTVLEAGERILPAEDEEISKIARKAFEARGIKFYPGIKLLNKKVQNGVVRVEFDLKGKIEQIKAEILLMAIGIVANTENIGLEKTKVKLEKGHIITDGLMQTAEEGIYAIGDVTGAPWLAHKASHEGIIAAETIAGMKSHPINRGNIPACTYSSPQIASVGMTEAAALAAGYKVKIGRFPFYANGKALILGDNEGTVKTIFDSKTGELLGAHMIGAEVTELIQGYVIAKSMEGTEIDLIQTVFPHPTISETMHESVLEAYCRQIHI